MTRLYNDPADFADEAIDGFAAAHRRHVRLVPGGVIRASVPDRPEVAVVIGGGSGHYPAFAGYVGLGLAHGAALGNVFASPSADQIYDVAMRTHTGAGVLLGYGNYAGDVLNFTRAQQLLEQAGIDARSVAVTDDLKSAPADERHRRRGIAGDLIVFKAAAAAAAAGQTLDDVVRVANKANAATNTIGVAFSGCTLPGAKSPLFDVQPGRMAVGMGIHGEPGLDECDICTADELANLLVDAVLAEHPSTLSDCTRPRAAVLVNGLGAVKYDELYVVYRAVARRLTRNGVTIVEPEVGELVTSFDMAGLSLTISWLDDELEDLWRAPADSPAFHRASPGPDATSARSSDVVAVESPGTRTVENGGIPRSASPVLVGTAASQAVSRTVVAALSAIEDSLRERQEELGNLDAVAGDGDHGIGMVRGAGAAHEAARQCARSGAGAHTTLNAAANAWANRAGGTSGALWGLILRTLADSLDDITRPAATAVAAAITSSATAVSDVGGASVGDKTMLDALVPFANELTEQLNAGQPAPDAWSHAASVAYAAAAATADLVPRVGRARPHAAKSLGTPDPGAVSLAAAAAATATVLVQHCAPG